MRAYLALLLLVLSACTAPAPQVSVGSGEIYIVNPAETFIGDRDRPDASAVPQFCPVEEGGLVPSCGRAATVPATGATISRSVTIDGTSYAVHRSALATPGRYAFLRASVTTRNSGIVTRATYTARNGTTVIDAQPNTVIVFPIVLGNRFAVIRDVRSGVPPAEAVSRHLQVFSDAQSIAVARAAVESIYGPSARNLNYVVAEDWAVNRTDAGVLRLVGKIE